MILKLQCSFEIRVKSITNQLICRTESSNFEVFYCIGKRSHSIFRNFIYPQLRRFGFLEEFILSHRRDSNCPPKNFLSTTSFLLRFSSTLQFRCLLQPVLLDSNLSFRHLFLKRLLFMWALFKVQFEKGMLFPLDYFFLHGTKLSIAVNIKVFNRQCR